MPVGMPSEENAKCLNASNYKVFSYKLLFRPNCFIPRDKAFCLGGWLLGLAQEQLWTFVAPDMILARHRGCSAKQRMKNWGPWAASVDLAASAALRSVSDLLIFHVHDWKEREPHRLAA